MDNKNPIEIKFIVCAETSHFSYYSNWKRELTPAFEIKMTEKSISYTSATLAATAPNKKTAQFRRMLSQGKIKDDVKICDTKTEAADHLISLINREKTVLQDMIKEFDLQLTELEELKQKELDNHANSGKSE